MIRKTIHLISLAVLSLAVFSLAVFSFLLLANPGFADSRDRQIQSAQILYTFPTCAHPSHRSSWCTDADVKLQIQKQNILSQLFNWEQNEPASEVFFSTFSFTYMALAKSLCEAAKSGANVLTIADSSYAKHFSVRFLASGCEQDLQKERITIVDLGGRAKSRGWVIQHTKFSIIEKENSDIVDLTFGTANGSLYSFGLHFDHWVKVQALKNSSFVRQHQCLKSALLAATKEESKTKEMAAFDTTLDSCRKKVGTLAFSEALQQEKIAPLFTPSQSDRVSQRLIQAIDAIPSGGSIKGLSQLFSSEKLAAALLRAVTRGVEVSLAMEDDTLSGKTDSYRTAVFYKRYLKHSGINFRFIETNSNIYQLMHMKFLILNEKLIFTGSGQHSKASLNTNYENFYFIEHSQLVHEYSELFNKMWGLGYLDPEPENRLISSLRNFFMNLRRNVLW